MKIIIIIIKHLLNGLAVQYLACRLPLSALMSIKVDPMDWVRMSTTRVRGRVLQCHLCVNINDLLLLLPYIQHRGNVINFILASKEL